MQGQLLIVDGMILAHKAAYALGWMKTKNQLRRTGTVFGFLRQLIALKKKVKPQRTVIAWDLQGKIKKAEDLADYKYGRGARDEDAELFYADVEDLKSVLGQTSCHQVEGEGFEADDLVAKELDLFGDLRPARVATRDHDMWQLVRDDVTVLELGKELKEITRKEVRERWGVEPEQMTVLRAVMGDQSDKLNPGLSRSTKILLKKRILANPEIRTVEELLQGRDGSGFEQLKRVERATRLGAEEGSYRTKPGTANETFLKAALCDREMFSLLGDLSYLTN